MNNISSIVKRQPLLTYFFLAFGLGWVGWVLYALHLYPTTQFTPGPFLAAIIVVSLAGGRAELRALLSQAVRWRVGLAWYAVAIFLPVVLEFSAALLNVALGARVPPLEALNSWPRLFIMFPLVLLIPIAGGAWAELGWRGFALPHLQKDFSPLTASLVLGVIYTAWHLPLIVIGQAGWWQIPMQIAATLVWTWIYNRTNGSVLLTAILHAAWNTVNGLYIAPMFSGVDTARLGWLYAAVWSLTAIVIVILGGLARPSESTSLQPETAQMPL